MRTVEISDKRIAKALKEKEALITEGRKLSAEIEELETKRNKTGLKVQKIKDDIILPFVKEFKKTIDKYEDLQTLSLSSDGKVRIDIFNYLEEYKKKLDEELAKAEEKPKQ